MYDIIVIGAGPAGSSAALFAAKAGKKTLIIDNDQSITKRAWVENHYGILEITGPDLVELGKKQATKFGAELISGKAIKIGKTSEGFQVETESEHYEGKHVILATGVLTDLAEQTGIETKPASEPRIKTVYVTSPEGKTSVEGIWAAGTAAGVSVHTIITAGDGAKVAINVISEINGERYVDHDMIKS
ncbi:Pyridine nucleotide-disulphide oxidoreductase [Paenibacillus sp. 1_12]|uniref:NAD(P)/FAD-dependent oxidoreductase n=1 Tax=Paenibacillus sp. 1_12 TaxID=1566278 RepID=UPI0008F0B3B8|nr:NAD(P)/FAD-dependent oxidoreductase [Paenibacillus sp. 1_12]SFL80750.1 Pyridine nucleotide-disulphide oxidoreductase [Paenibacillus sp. 1_12]